MRGLVRLSAETDRVYTINLGKVLLSPDNRRAKRAINMMREFARHHMGVSEVKIDMDVSQYIWSKGIRHPPRKIRVRLNKTDEGHILISKYEGEQTASTEVKDIPAKDKPKDVKSKPADVKDAPVNDKPADVKDAPVNDKPADVKDAPVNDKPADVKDAPVNDKPADVKDAPVNDKPADVKDAPVNDKPKDADKKSTN